MQQLEFRRAITWFVRSGCIVLALHAQAWTQSLFEAPRVHLDGRRYLAAGDVDGDGDTDLLRYVVNGGTDIAVDLNDGTGLFPLSTTTNVPLLQADSPAKLIDLSGDGVLDCALGIFDSATQTYYLSVLMGDGLGGFGPGSAYVLTGPLGPLAVGDADADGQDDLLFTYSDASASGGFLRWLMARPGGIPQLGARAPGPLMAPMDRSPQIADLDFDGDADLAISTRVGNMQVASTWLTTGFGTLITGPSRSIPLGIGYAEAGVVAVDIQSDGDTDFVFCQVNEQQRIVGTQVWINNASLLGVLGPYRATQTGYPSGGDFFAQDLNNDGVQDLLYRSEVRSAVLTNTGTYTIYEMDPSFRWLPRASWPHQQPLARGVGFADLNGDSNLDFVGPSESFIGTGRLLPFGSFIGLSAYVTMGDLDTDGDPDLFWTGFFEQFTNDGNGFFDPPPPQPVNYPTTVPGFSYYSSFPVDWDGDGDTDVCAGFSVSVGPTVGMRRLRNDGGAQLVDAGPLFTTGNPISDLNAENLPSQRLPVLTPERRFQDFSGDGLIDFVFGDNIYFGFPTGPFAPDPTTPFAGWRVADAGDVDGDGDPDLIGAPVTPDFTQLALFTNQGGGAFTSSIIPGVAPRLGSFLLDDLDLDGDADLVVVEAPPGISSTLRIYEATSTGFGLRTSIPLGLPLSPVHFQSGDLDLDGDIDLFVGGNLLPAFPSTFVRIFRGAGAPFVFDPPEIFALGHSSHLVDTDGDGDLDIAGNFNVKNRTFEGPSAGRRLQYGQGVSGSDGRIPDLGATGPFRVGAVGELRLSGVLGGAAGVLSVGVPASPMYDFPFFGMTTYNYPWTALIPFAATGAPGVSGAGNTRAALPFPPFLANTETVLQAAFADPNAPLGLSQSRPLSLTIGP